MTTYSIKLVCEYITLLLQSPLIYKFFFFNDMSIISKATAHSNQKYILVDLLTKIGNFEKKYSIVLNTTTSQTV